jgi:hypothetical protein
VERLISVSVLFLKIKLKIMLLMMRKEVFSPQTNRWYISTRVGSEGGKSHAKKMENFIGHLSMSH